MGGSIPISQTGRLMTVNELCCCPQALTIATDLIISIAHVYGSANHQSESRSGLSKAPCPPGPSRKETVLAAAYWTHLLKSSAPSPPLPMAQGSPLL